MRSPRVLMAMAVLVVTPGVGVLGVGSDVPPAGASGFIDTMNQNCTTKIFSAPGSSAFVAAPTGIATLWGAGDAGLAASLSAPVTGASTLGATGGAAVVLAALGGACAGYGIGDWLNRSFGLFDSDGVSVPSVTAWESSVLSPPGLYDCTSVTPVWASTFAPPSSVCSMFNVGIRVADLFYPSGATNQRLYIGTSRNPPSRMLATPSIATAVFGGSSISPSRYAWSNFCAPVGCTASGTTAAGGLGAGIQVAAARPSGSALDSAGFSWARFNRSWDCNGYGADCGMTPGDVDWLAAGDGCFNTPNQIPAADGSVCSLQILRAVNPDLNEHGNWVAQRAKTECWVPTGVSDGYQVVSTTVTSAWFREFDGAPSEFLPSSCPPGSIPKGLTIDLLTKTGTIVIAPRRLFEHQMPATTITDPAQTRECYTVGSPGTCPVVDVPGDVTKVRIGGPAGKIVDRTIATPTIATTIADLVDTGKITAPTTVTTPTTTPASTAPPVTTVASCGVQCTEPVPTPDVAAGNACFSSGYSWNPVSWVLVPVKCALLWAFWDAPAFEEFKGRLDARIGPWASFLGGLPDMFEFTSAAGPCWDFGQNLEICMSDFLTVDMGDTFPVLFGSAYLFAACWEVIGFFVRMTVS